jgi:hypothetical protein
VGKVTDDKGGIPHMVTIAVESYGSKSVFNIPFTILERAIFSSDLFLFETIKKMNEENKMIKRQRPRK